MSQQTPVLQLENFVPCVTSTNMMSTTESNFSKTAEELASENGDSKLTTLERSHSLPQPIFSQTPVLSTSALLLRGVSQILPTPPATPQTETLPVEASFEYQMLLPPTTPLNPSTSLPQLTDSMIGEFIATPSELTMNAITSTQCQLQPASEHDPVQQVLSEVQRKQKRKLFEVEEENEEVAHASKRQKVNAERFVRSINFAFVQNRAFPTDACEDLMRDLVEQFEFSSRLSFTDRKTLHNLIIVYLMEFAEPKCSTAELETLTVNLFAQTIPDLQAKAETRGTVNLTCANTRTPGGYR